MSGKDKTKIIRAIFAAYMANDRALRVCEKIPHPSRRGASRPSPPRATRAEGGEKEALLAATADPPPPLARARGEEGEFSRAVPEHAKTDRNNSAGFVGDANPGSSWV